MRQKALLILSDRLTMINQNGKKKNKNKKNEYKLCDLYVHNLFYVL